MPQIRVHALYHAPFEGLGAIAPWLTRHSCHLEETKVYAGEALPQADSFDWLIVMGGPMSVHDEVELPWLVGEKQLIAAAIESGKAILGICLGAQLISAVMGGNVTRNREKEIGWFPVFSNLGTVGKKMEKENWLNKIFPETLMTFHWHGETFSLPEGAILLASSQGCDHQGFVFGEKIVALQFHPEMDEAGIKKLIAHCDSDRKPGNYVQEGDAIWGRSEYFEANQFFLEEILLGLRNRILKT